MTRIGVFVLLLAACGVVQTKEIVATSGDGQQATVGTQLGAPFVVTVVDLEGVAVENYTVNFRVTSGSGVVSESAVRSDIEGRAKTTLTLGPGAGINTVEAIDDEGTSSVTFSATGVAGPAMMIDLVHNDQSGTVATPLAQPLVAMVVDANHNPVSGVSLMFAVTANNGALSAASGISDADGQVTTSLTLGTAAGLNTVAVTSTTGGVGGATFSATGIADAPAEITAITTGALSATAGTTLATPLTVEVADRFGNPVAGATVMFTPTAGGGSVSPTQAITTITGQASTTLTAGNAVGTNIVRASVSGVATSATFQATGLVGAPAKVIAMSGDGQIGKLGQSLGAPYVVAVLDTHNNPVSGATVSFVVVDGGGAIASTATTDSNGRAQATLTLGPSGRRHAIEARVGAATPARLTASAASFDSLEGIAYTNTNMGVGDVAVADFNGDQRPDVATITAGNELTIELNTTSPQATTATWSSPASFRVNGTNGARGLTVGDFNQDDKPDLAFVAVGIYPSVPAYLSVFLNTTATNASTPSFAAALPITVNYRCEAIAVSDLNADGKPDLLIAEPNTQSVHIYMNTTLAGATTASFVGGGTVYTAHTIISSSSYHHLALDDLNADSRPDLAILTAAGVNVLLNTTSALSMSPTFATPMAVTTGSGASDLRIGDMTSDGAPDLVVGRSGAIEIHANTMPAQATTPTFASATSYSAPGYWLALGDFNGDGRPDVATAGTTSQLSVLLNAGTTLVPATFSATTGGALAAADLNGDGGLDLVYAASPTLHTRLAN